MPSYIHIDGDFNPWRVTVARVHRRLHPRRVHEEATMSIPSWLMPTKDYNHSCRSSQSRRSLCPYKLLGSTPQDLGGLQVIPNQSRRHHSPKGNRWCCWWWTPRSCASKDSLLNTQALSHRFGLGRRRIGVESNLNRLEIKVQMVGLESLDLNTWVGGSLSENKWWKLYFVLKAFLLGKRGWRGYK